MPPAKKMMTMRDLAKIAGVNHSTVSLALRHSVRVAPRTRQKILRLAEQHGYVMNPLISACMTFRKRVHANPHAHSTLAFLVNYPPGISWRHDSLPLNYNGALHQAESHGYRLEEFLIPSRLTAQRVCQILQARNIHGVIVAPLYPDGKAQLDFLWEKFCAVAIGLSLKEPHLYHVAHDYYHGMRLALSECRKRGLRRPGFVSLESTNKRLGSNWMAAYLLEQQSYSPSDRLRPFVLKGNALDVRALRQWAASERPDSILSLQMVWPETERWKEIVAGLPGPVEWISLDVKNRGDDQAGIYQNHEKVGAAAADLLIRLVEINQPGALECSETLLIEGAWIEGKRQGRVRPSPAD